MAFVVSGPTLAVIEGRALVPSRYEIIAPLGPLGCESNMKSIAFGFDKI